MRKRGNRSGKIPGKMYGKIYEPVIAGKTGLFADRPDRCSGSGQSYVVRKSDV